MKWKSEILALIFGMLIILIIFGDSVPAGNVGNLDTIFGQKYWPVMDVIYPLASIIIFLSYGKVNGAVRLNFRSVTLFLLFLFSIMAIQFDDIFVVFGRPIELSDTFWEIVRWQYLVLATGTFLLFGDSGRKK